MNIEIKRFWNGLVDTDTWLFKSSVVYSPDNLSSVTIATICLSSKRKTILQNAFFYEKSLVGFVSMMMMIHNMTDDIVVDVVKSPMVFVADG